MAQLKRDVGSLVNSTREELQTAIEVSATRSASLVQEVRSTYSEELGRVHHLRSDVSAAVEEMRTTLAGTDRRAEETAARAEGLLGEQREVIEEADRKRQRDRVAFETELKGIKKRLGGVFDNSDVVSRGLEHVCDVLGLLLEAVGMQCALDWQDTMDREHIHLLGLKEELGSATKSPPQTHAQPLPSPRATRKASPRRAKAPRVISVEQRCLSCSSQAPAVLTAFKLACLQYNPSAVQFGDAEHSRFDLIKRIEEVLGQASGLYAAGLRSGGGVPKSKALGQYVVAPSAVPGTDKVLRLPSLPRSMPATPRSKTEAPHLLH